MSSRRYVPGRGRGATGFIGGVSRDEVGMRRLFEAGSGDIRWAPEPVTLQMGVKELLLLQVGLVISPQLEIYRAILYWCWLYPHL